LTEQEASKAEQRGLNVPPLIDVVLRRAEEAELDEITRLFRLWCSQAWDFLAPHTPEGDLRHIRKSWRAGPVWTAFADDRIVGFCAARSGWIDHFFVAPEWQGCGVGRALIARALRGRRRVRLWTFQRNTRSRLFYALQGFREVRRTDGQGNEEHEPDVLLEWRRD
jgi:GNAT superfamily N-acetyltransferase